MAYIDRVLRPGARLTLPLLALLLLAGPSVRPETDGWLDGHMDPGGATSVNWAGRLRPGPEVRSVGAIFNVPTAAQRKSGEAEYASVWDGIGGASTTSTSLVQAGLHISVSAAGEASYSTFVEGLTRTGGFLFSSTPVAVSAGQWIEILVTATGSGQVSYLIDNLSSNQTYQHTSSFPADGSSAEWIVEGPSTSCNGSIAEEPLADYRSVGFEGLQENAKAPSFGLSNLVVGYDPFGELSLPVPSFLARGKTATYYLPLVAKGGAEARGKASCNGAGFGVRGPGAYNIKVFGGRTP